MAYLFLKQNDQSHHTNVDQVVHNASQEVHFEKARDDNPSNDEEENSRKDIGSARLLHQFPDIIKQ